jgi:hypothetical protein
VEAVAAVSALFLFCARVDPQLKFGACGRHATAARHIVDTHAANKVMGDEKLALKCHRLPLRVTKPRNLLAEGAGKHRSIHMKKSVPTLMGAGSAVPALADASPVVDILTDPQIRFRFASERQPMVGTTTCLDHLEDETWNYRWQHHLNQLHGWKPEIVINFQ